MLLDSAQAGEFIWLPVLAMGYAVGIYAAPSAVVGMDEESLAAVDMIMMSWRLSPRSGRECGEGLDCLSGGTD